MDRRKIAAALAASAIAAGSAYALVGGPPAPAAGRADYSGLRRTHAAAADAGAASANAAMELPSYETADGFHAAVQHVDLTGAVDFGGSADSDRLRAPRLPAAVGYGVTLPPLRVALLDDDGPAAGEQETPPPTEDRRPPAAPDFGDESDESKSTSGSETTGSETTGSARPPATPSFDRNRPLRLPAMSLDLTDAIPAGTPPVTTPPATGSQAGQSASGQPFEILPPATRPPADAFPTNPPPVDVPSGPASVAVPADLMPSTAPVPELVYEAPVDFHADVDALASDPHLSRYAGRVRAMSHGEPLPHPIVGRLEMPNARLWWEGPVRRPLWPALQGQPVDVNKLVLSALENSPDVLAMRLDPEIVRHSVTEEEAAFDWSTFVENTYDDISDPVGNTLTTGGADRLRDKVLSSTSGGRRTNRVGGEFEVSQRLGYQDNNSQFFLPSQQAASRLTLSYTQPLLNGRGEAYQESQIVLAKLDAAETQQGTDGELQDHLLDVAESYWDLYRARCLYLQRRKVLIQAERALATLEGRALVDALPRQILRARSAVTDRRSQIVRAAMDVRNAESQLRMLVGDPVLAAAGGVELLPIEAPTSTRFNVSIAGSAATALMSRPDIKRSVQRLRSQGVQLGVAEHELMPRLDLVLSGYLSGLEGEGNIRNSFGDQFTEGRPSFAAGLLFEVPLGRRAAQARVSRRRLELVQATHQFEAVVEAALTEVELAVREVDTSYREMAGRYEAMKAAEDEAAYFEDRWSLVPGGTSASRLLEDLLDAQERLTDEEGGLTTAQVNYLLALAHLRRSTGTLLQFGPVKQAVAATGGVATRSQTAVSKQAAVAPAAAEEFVR